MRFEESPLSVRAVFKLYLTALSNSIDFAMALLIITLLFGQYTDVYLPHQPPGVESGVLGVAFGFDLELAYQRWNVNDSLTHWIASQLAFSPDGFNEVAVDLPWFGVLTDSLNHIHIGNLGLHYKRRIFSSVRYGYLSAKLMARLPTAPDTLGTRDALGGRTSAYGLGVAYTYELPLLREYHDLFGVLPVVASVAVEDTFITRDHDNKNWAFDFAPLIWGISVDILPIDYVFVGAAVQGSSGGVDLLPYLGVRYYWVDLVAAYRLGSENRFETFLRLYL